MSTSAESHAAATAAVQPARARIAKPRYIVLFNEVSERNVSILSDLKGIKEAPGISMRVNGVTLARKEAGEAYTRVYHRIAVAAADLNDDERNRLTRNPQVAMIVQNEARHIPPLKGIQVYSGKEMAAQSAPVGVSPAIAYLQGLRDAAQAALVFEQMRGGAVAPVMTGMVGPRVDTTWCLALINVLQGSALTGKGVKVAVLDTGVDLNHPDFANRFVAGHNAMSFVDGASVQDGNGHGTHCAGIICGPAQPAGGARYGVAPGAEVMVGKVLDDTGSGSDDSIVEGISWAVEQGAQVVSMSLGSRREVNQQYAALYERIAGVESRVLFVAAAGNDSQRDLNNIAPIENPAACPSFMAVAAVDSGKDIAYFSNGQRDYAQVGISAPGVGVYSSWPGGKYATLDGTSMATPHVAGVAALLLEKQQHLSRQQLQTQLKAAASKLLPDTDFGAGIVKAP